MANPLWVRRNHITASNNKLFLQSGFYTSTIKTSQDVGTSIDTKPYGITYDDTNTMWNGFEALKAYLTSGLFTSTLKTSLGSWTNLFGMGWDSPDTLSAKDSFITDRIIKLSGQFTSTVKTSLNVGSVDANPRDITWDGTNSPWAGSQAEKLYLTSGQFTSTLKDSEDVSATDTIGGISWDGTNTPWAGDTYVTGTVKLYYQSGQFTSTIKDSEGMTLGGAWNMGGIGTDDYAGRVGGGGPAFDQDAFRFRRDKDGPL